jgi:hypothetical protein
MSADWTAAVLILVGVIALWLVAKITDISLKTIVHDTIEEFRHLLEAKINLKAANALGLILMFVLILYLNFGGLSHISLPEKGSAAHPVDLVKTGANILYVFMFATVLILSIRLTKYTR